MMEDTEEVTLEQEDSPVAPAVPEVDLVLLRKIIEGAILAANQPLTVARMLELFEQDAAPTKEAVQAALEAIQEDCAERGYELKEVASGWRFQVRENLAGWVNRLWEEKPQKYSRALLETLALIAYRQPITRGDIEEIRGVAVSSHIMKTLMERDWVKVVGHRDVPGRPSLYATTRQFLDYFNLKRLEDLPSLSDIRDLDEMNSVLELNVDDEGLGEPDTDVTENSTGSAPENVEESATDSDAVDQPDVEVVATEVSVTELEEFVDGEAAFENADPVQSKILSEELAADQPEALETTPESFEADENQSDEPTVDDLDGNDPESEDPLVPRN